MAASCGGDSSTATPTAPAPAPGTDPVTGQMAPGGVVFHQFVASAAGAVNITLTATDPPGTLVGLGIGIPGGNVGSCDLTQSVQTRPGSTAQISVLVDSGTFCAGTFDVGGLGKNGVLVTYSVAHP